MRRVQSVTLNYTRLSVNPHRRALQVQSPPPPPNSIYRRVFLFFFSRAFTKTCCKCNARFMNRFFSLSSVKRGTVKGVCEKEKRNYTYILERKCNINAGILMYFCLTDTCVNFSDLLIHRAYDVRIYILSSQINRIHTKFRNKCTSIRMCGINRQEFGIIYNCRFYIYLFFFYHSTATLGMRHAQSLNQISLATLSVCGKDCVTVLLLCFSQ